MHLGRKGALPLQAMPASVGLLMPSALVLGSLVWGDDRLLLATCLVPYVETLLAQIWMEGHFTEKGGLSFPHTAAPSKIPACVDCPVSAQARQSPSDMRKWALPCKLAVSSATSEISFFLL